MGVSLHQPRFNRRGNSFYDPCLVGLHLCGSAAAPGDDYEQPYTALNLPARDHGHARAMYAAAKAEAECAKDEADFCCDLALGTREAGPEIDDGFWTNRQLVNRLVAAASQDLAA